jgi:ABC-type multidrug transport system ATPase subunit
MIPALELRAITKRFTVGSGACVASADVLRGVSLSVASGESLALVGASGAGKSTLMLCAAGLLSHEAGEVRWFGEAARTVAASRAAYHCAPGDLLNSRCVEQPAVHLLDVPFGSEACLTIARWIEQRCDAGDAVIVSTRDPDLAHRVASRAVVLRGGRLHPESRPQSRVAEYARQ